MTISSRTPEGNPFACRVCGAVGRVEPSPLVGDAVCPRCGSYLSQLRARFSNWDLGFGLETPLWEDSTWDDSLDLVETLMDFEESLGFSLDPEAMMKCKTLAELIRYLRETEDRNRR